MAMMGNTVLAESPQAVAEVGLRTIYDRKAAELDRVAHPELKKRIRASQLIALYLSSRKIPVDVQTLSDEEVARLFYEVLEIALPLDQGFDYVCEYLSSEAHGDYMLLTFKTGPRSKKTHETDLRKESVVLKREGDRWLFLWSLPMAFNVDPRWDARKELASKRPEGRPDDRLPSNPSQPSPQRR